MLEDALVGAVRQVGELRHDCQAIAGQAFAGLALFDPVDQAVDTVAIGAEGKEGALVQQAGQIEIRAFADQLDVEAVGLADGLTWCQMTPSAFDLFLKNGFEEC